MSAHNTAPRVPASYSAEHYRRYYLPEDLEPHSTSEDCWVSIHGRVLDISRLLIAKKGDPLCRPLTKNAGLDISHWFDVATGNPKQYIDVEQSRHRWLLPEGRFLHVPPELPGEFEYDFTVPWWKDPQYLIGHLTKKPRQIRIINTLTHHEETLEVPSEETLEEIQRRYMSINKHSKSYTWKDCYGKLLDQTKTLESNGITDEDAEYDYLDIADADRHIPSILIYYNDDLTDD
jgi:Cytochrome b5-like Heme/Steroid binding domain